MLRIDRRGFLHTGALGLASPIIFRAQALDAREIVVAETANGSISGLSDNGILSFRGVAYAATTGGENRFRAPQPVEAWTGVRPAFQDGSRCPQAPETFRGQDWSAWYDQAAPYGEDCCVLNIFTPSLERGAKRPVMMYIHGGGFRSGGGGGPGLDGSNLARYGDTVVVSINHRLNVLGYLNLGVVDPDFEDAANAGQLDIVAALKWVHDNVERFGGDPDRVTVFGQSGGGSKITALMTMPDAQPLYHAAINMSGVTALTLMTSEVRTELTEEFLAQAGVVNKDLRALQTMPYAQLAASYDAAVKRLGVDDFRPVVDGLHIPANPLTPEGLAISADKPLIVGSTETEATIWLGRTPGIAALSEDDLTTRVAAQFKIEHDATREIIRGYRVDRADRTPYEVLAAVATDAVFRGRMLRGVEARAQNGGAPVYLYNFAWRLPVDEGVWHSPHTADIPFAFGNTDVASMMTGHASDVSRVERRMMSSFTAFAKTGRPDNADTPPWAPYDLAERMTMVMDDPAEATPDYLGGDRVASEAIIGQDSFQLLAGPLFRGVEQ